MGASLSSLFISQSYQSLIHLGDDTTIKTFTSTPAELQDGFGNGSGVLLDNAGNVIASGSLKVVNDISSSTLNGVGNVTIYSASVASRLAQLEADSGSQDQRLDSLEVFTASAAISIASLNASSASQQISINSLNTFSASAEISINSLNSKTGSYATTGSNTFTGINTFNLRTNLQGVNIYSGSNLGIYIGNSTGFAPTSAGVVPSDSHTVFGVNALQLFGNGDLNSAFGRSALQQLISGSNNLAMGGFAGNQLVNGGGNTFIGDQAGNGTVGGDNNFFLGGSSGNAFRTGSFNIHIGVNQQGNLATGSGNLIIGGAGGTNVANNVDCQISIKYGTDFQGRRLLYKSGSEADNVFIYGGVEIQNTLTASLADGYVWIGNSSGRSTTFNFTDFSQSVDSKIDNLELYTASFSSNYVSQAQLAAATGALETSIATKLNTSSFNAYTQSADAALNNLSQSVSSSNAVTIARIDGLASFTGSYATTGSNTFRGNEVFSGSVRGQVFPITVSSNTASMDCSIGNFFTVSLPSGSTRFEATNIQPGETLSLRILNLTNTSAFTGSTSVKFPNGFGYVPTTVSSSIDILTFLSFDTGSIFAVASNYFL